MSRKMSLYETELEYQLIVYDGPKKKVKRIVQTYLPLEKWNPYMFSKMRNYLISLQKTRCDINIINARNLGLKGTHEEVKG